jgi:hypothetical protein
VVSGGADGGIDAAAGQEDMRAGVERGEEVFVST